MLETWICREKKKTLEMKALETFSEYSQGKYNRCNDVQQHLGAPKKCKSAEPVKLVSELRTNLQLIVNWARECELDTLRGELISLSIIHIMYLFYVSFDLIVLTKTRIC